MNPIVMFDYWRVYCGAIDHRAWAASKPLTVGQWAGNGEKMKKTLYTASSIVIIYIYIYIALCTYMYIYIYLHIYIYA